MSSHADFNEDASNRTYRAPYTARHPVPNVQDYAAHQEERQTQAPAASISDSDEAGESKLHALIDSAKSHLHIHGQDKESSQEQLYSGQNRNLEPPAPTNETHQGQGQDQRGPKGQKPDKLADQSSGESTDDTSESKVNEPNSREKRKQMKHMERSSKTREVTDPITHLPVMIHDSTNDELNAVPKNYRHSSLQPTAKSENQLGEESEQSRREHEGLEKLFPPPNFDATRKELVAVYQRAVLFGLGSLLFIFLALLVGWQLAAFSFASQGPRDWPTSWSQMLIHAITIIVPGLGIGGGLIWAVCEWVGHKTNNIWENQVWEAARKKEQDTADSPTPESTQWLNSLLASVWYLINPDLFAGLADTLEDVMQASLPKLVRMISVEDLGQGSEAIRILGVRWLPRGAAAKDVSVSGKIKSGKEGQDDQNASGEGQVDRNNMASEATLGEGRNISDDHPPEEEGQDKVAEGMEAEEGDFVNMELAFSYRASSRGKSLKVKSKNAHLYLAFYLPGGIRLPVWVELHGIVGTMRLRLQLCPDPPFFSLCTLTFLGQPKADLSCVPLTKKGLNIMDLPIISSFVQSSVDAALAEYVAPKSLTLDLKDLLVGDDFKKDTSGSGVVMVRIKSAKGFKEGDGGIMGLKRGSSDPYVAVGWAKFGKPIWSTRVIIEEMEPVWEETAFILVGPEELNAGERLRVQLWDSDRGSADDDLGRVEVDLKELMQSSQSNGKIWDRHDGLQALEGDDAMPGTLDWSVGYFGKTRIQKEQLKLQDQESDINNIQQLKDRVSDDTERKMREAGGKNESVETEQQKAQDLKTREGNMIISSPPSPEYPTGILSIQIHEITGLEYEKIQSNQAEADDNSDAEGAGDLPSSYCTIILNHQKIFQTRTKPKNTKPFFNAGTERVIRDWRTTEIMISVRDSRVRENDPLLGIVYLRLGHLFGKRSQVIDKFPLVGGIGYGRARISLVFRSVQIQAPKELLGWDYGTFEVTGPITSQNIASDLQGLRLKLRTTVNRVKVYPSRQEEEVEWRGRKDRPVRLAVRKRYNSCLVIEFRKNSLGLDKTPAFAILWLKDIPDDEEMTVTLPVWRGDAGLKRAEANCIQDVGEKMGTIDIPLKFWHGLSGYHHRLASKNRNVQDVLEVLETANDNKEVRSELADEEDGSDSSSSSSDSSSSDDNEVLNAIRKKGSKVSATISGREGRSREDDGRRGPLDQFSEYKDHSEQLHRRHRGVMQWKGVRTANWMKTKVKRGKDQVLDKLGAHGDREGDQGQGVETEV